MDQVVVINVGLFLLLINAALINATRLQCFGLKCTISDVKSAEDFFVLQYVKKNIVFIKFQHIQMKHLDTSLLNLAEDPTRHLLIEHSDALTRITISTASTVAELYITSMTLKSIHFETNHHLYSLTVAESRLMIIPPTVHRAIGLQTFQIISSAIRSLDLAVFCDLPQLKELNFDGNKINSVVNSCQRRCKVYDTLVKITLSNNLLKTVSMTSFRAFGQLRKLKLQHNIIRLFTGSIASDMLQELDVSYNELKSISVCSWRIPFLTVLTLSSNQLTNLPACLDNLKTLKTLTIGANRISSLDFSELGWMDNLEQLHLNHNRIRSLTLNSSDFPMKLNKLNVYSNNMTELHLLLVPVEALSVNVAYNQITRFDINVTSKNITALTMAGNPMDCSWSNPEMRMHSKCYQNT